MIKKVNEKLWKFIESKADKLKIKRKYKKKYSRKYKIKYKRKCRRGKKALIICAIIIPFMLVVAILIMPLWTKVNYTPAEQIESMGLTVIGIAVSVWIGLNIYNAVSVNELEEALLRLDKLDMQFKRYCFMSELLKTKKIYEISGYIYEEFENIDSEDIDYEMLFEIEKNYALCYTAYEKNLWDASREYAQDTIYLINSIRNKRGYEEIIKQYLDIRLSDMYFYKNISLPRSGDVPLNKEEIEKSIVLYENILEELKYSDIDEEIRNLYSAYILNSQGYAQFIYYKDTKEEHKIKEAEEKLEKAVRLNGKGRYYRNLGLVYSYYARKEYSDRDYLKLARDIYQEAIDKDKEDYKAYINYASNILQSFDCKFEINNRRRIIPELKIKPEEVDKKRLQKCINYLEVAKGISPTFEDAYFNLGKAYMYKYLFDSRHGVDYLKQGLQYAKTTQALSKGNVSHIYVIRNLYECKKDIKKALYYNKKLAGKGDSENIEQLYKDYLES